VQHSVFFRSGTAIADIVSINFIFDVSILFCLNAAFNALWGIIEEIFLKKTERHQKIVRFWCAGCSEGEEPYTISLLVHEILGELLSNYLVSIHATDIDEDALEKAKRGAYLPEKLKNLSEEFLGKYFTKFNDKYLVKDDVKKLVKFQKHDLLKGSFTPHFDLIVCRNLFIYIEKNKQEEIIKKFHDALNPGGYLFLGNTETLMPAAKKFFETIDNDNRIYRRRE